MKKLVIVIILLAVVFIGMLIYQNLSVGTKSDISIQEIEKIQNYISKIYCWKEITEEALPTFEEINQANELWIWEVVKKNLEEYEVSYETLQVKAEELFGKSLEKEFPKEGNESFEYEKETNTYLATETILDNKEEDFILENIEKINNGYTVEVIEYLEDYTDENNIIIRNLNEEEIQIVDISESETKIQEIVKQNKDRFTKKKVYLENENDRIIVQKIEKE